MIALRLGKNTLGMVFLAVTLAISACSGLGSTKPTSAVITAPAANSQVMVGDVVTIQGQATGSNITRVDVIVDSSVQGSVQASDKTQGVSSLPVVITWTTQLVGAHYAQLNVYGQNNKMIAKSDAVVFNTKAAPATPAPTLPPATPTRLAPTSFPTAAPISTTTELTLTSALTATSALTPAVTVNNDSGFVNVRSGPDITYDLIGKLNQGDTVPLKGKNADGSWWQITFGKGKGGVGWVRGDLVVANAAAKSVPVVSAPPRPTAPPMTDTPPGPTATPPSVAQATSAATASGPVCNASSSDWRGANPNYPFCVKADFNWGNSAWDWTVFDNGRDGKIFLNWNIYGSNINQVWIHFVHDATICSFDRPAQKTVNQQVGLTGPYNFNVIDFPYGGTYRVYLEITLTDGRVVQWGEKKLCIR